MELRRPENQHQRAPRNESWRAPSDLQTINVLNATLRFLEQKAAEISPHDNFGMLETMRPKVDELIHLTRTTLEDFTKCDTRAKAFHLQVELPQLRSELNELRREATRTDHPLKNAKGGFWRTVALVICSDLLKFESDLKEFLFDQLEVLVAAAETDLKYLQEELSKPRPLPPPTDEQQMQEAISRDKRDSQWTARMKLRTVDRFTALVKIKNEKIGDITEDQSLTSDEKAEAINLVFADFEAQKIGLNQIPSVFEEDQ